MSNRASTAGHVWRSRGIAALVVLVLAAGGCAATTANGGAGGGGPSARPEPQEPPSASSSPPTVPAALMFSADLVGGGRFDGATLAGQPVVVWFWAAWCPRCRAKAGDVKTVQSDVGPKIAFVGVAGLSSGTDAMKSFVDQYGLNGFPQLADDSGTVWRHFGVVEQEYFVIIDATGSIVHKGPLTTDGLRDRIRTLIG